MKEPSLSRTRSRGRHLTACAAVPAVMLAVLGAASAGTARAATGTESSVDAALLSDAQVAEATGAGRLSGRAVVAFPTASGAKASVSWHAPAGSAAGPVALTLRGYRSTADASAYLLEYAGEQDAGGRPGAWHDQGARSTVVLPAGRALVRAACTAGQRARARDCAAALAQAQARAWLLQEPQSPAERTLRMQPAGAVEGLLLTVRQAQEATRTGSGLRVSEVSSRRLEGGLVSEVAYLTGPAEPGRIAPASASVQQWGATSAAARAWASLPAYYARNFWQPLRIGRKELAYDTGDASGSRNPGTQVSVWLRRGTYVVSGSCGTVQGSAPLPELLQCARDMARAQGRQAEVLLVAGP